MSVKTEKNLSILVCNREVTHLIYSSWKSFCKIYSDSVYIYKPPAIKCNDTECPLLHFKRIIHILFLVIQEQIKFSFIIWLRLQIFLRLRGKKNPFTDSELYIDQILIKRCLVGLLHGRGIKWWNKYYHVLKETYFLSYKTQTQKFGDCTAVHVSEGSVPQLTVWFYHIHFSFPLTTWLDT